MLTQYLFSLSDLVTDPDFQPSTLQPRIKSRFPSLPCSQDWLYETSLANRIGSVVSEFQMGSLKMQMLLIDILLCPSPPPSLVLDFRHHVCGRLDYYFQLFTLSLSRIRQPLFIVHGVHFPNLDFKLTDFGQWDVIGHNVKRGLECTPVGWFALVCSCQ